MRRHCAGTAIAGGTLMRHFLFCVAFSRAPSVLPGGMLRGALMAGLIAHTGTLTRLPPANSGALPRTVNLPPIAAAADVHLLATACAAIHPM